MEEHSEIYRDENEMGWRTKGRSVFSGRVSESWEVLGWGNGLIWFCEDSLKYLHGLHIVCLLNTTQNSTSQEYVC